MKTLYIDNVSLSVFLKLIFFKRKKFEIRVLNEQSFYQKFLINFLTLFRYNIKLESFFFGDIKGDNGESLHISARKKASILSLKFSKWIMKNKHIIKNNKYCKESKRIVELFISKRTMLEFEYYTQRIEYIKSKNNYNDKVYLWIRNSFFINDWYLNKSFESINLFLFNSIKNTVSFKIKLFFKVIIKNFLELFSFIDVSQLNYKYYPLVTLASDEINLNTNNRHFPHWFNKKNNYATLIINNQLQKIRLLKKDLSENKISIINKIQGSNLYFFKKNIKIKLSDKKDFKYGMISNLDELFSMAKNYYFFFKKIRCKKFLYLEPQYPITDAVQLISEDLKIKTICIQYANLGVIAPLMIPSSDYFLIFSNIYKKVFKWNDLGPKKFQSIGYSFINKDNYKDDVDLKINKKNFIISYFDESVQNYKWGYHSEQKNKEIIEKLASLVLKNENIFVVLKPQFVFNTVRNIKSKIIDKALNSGRLMEITKGTYRNLVAPTQIGRISDLSIAHVGGGTAALEIALNNRRVVMINEGGYITNFDSLYKKGKIMYNSLDEILKLLPKRFKKEKILIGDWSSIINNFSVNHLNSKAFINKIILKK